MGFGTLGYAVPAAIGAALAAPERPVVAICGDGGLQFSAAELLTAKDENVNLTLIVHANGGYVEIDNSMRSSGIEPVGVNLLVPDLYAMASSCAWNCVELDKLANFSTLLQNAQHNTTPTLIILNDCLFNSCGE